MLRMVRWVTCVTVVLGASGCFSGSSAAGLPCDDDDQCGTELRCEMGVCGGPSTTSEQPTTTDAPTSTTMTASTDETTTMPSTSSTSADTTMDPGSSSTTSSESSSTSEGPPVCTPPPDRSVCDPKTSPLNKDAIAIALAMPQGEINPTAVTVGDYVGNSALDFAVGSHTSQRITIFGNNGAGGFDDAETSDATDDFIVDMVDLDLECDGTTDFLTVGYQAQLERFTLENGELVPGDSIDVSLHGFSLAVGDIVDDEQQRPEVVVAQGHETNRVEIVGIVEGTLGVHGAVDGFTGNSPWEIGLYDLGLGNGVQAFVANSNIDDGDVTLANDVVSVLGFDTWQPYQADESPVAANFRTPYAIAFGTFTAANAGIEIAVAEKYISTSMNEESQEPGRVRIFGIDRMRDPIFVQRASFMVGVGPRAMAAADLDCDGLHDLVISHSGIGLDGDGELQVRFGGELETADVVVGTLGGGSTRIGVGDFDGNGAPEAAVADWATPRVHIVRATSE
jgi:hypothetical protein